MSKRTIAAAAATAVVLCLAAGTRAEDAATRQEDSAIEERSEDVVQGDTATVEDQTFVCRAAEGSAAEVELADLALTKSDNDSVKEFAEQMKRDRSAAQGVLAQAASREGIDVPKTLDDQHRTIKAELEKLDGPEFDRRYMNYMLQGAQEGHRAVRGEGALGRRRRLGLRAADGVGPRRTPPQGARRERAARGRLPGARPAAGHAREPAARGAGQRRDAALSRLQVERPAARATVAVERDRHGAPCGGGRYGRPPSTRRIAPVVKLDASDAK